MEIQGSAFEHMNYSTIENEDRMCLKDQDDSIFLKEGNTGRNAGVKTSLKKGPWTFHEDVILAEYVKQHGTGNWSAIQKHSGLSRCAKSCRQRWVDHLRSDLRKGSLTIEEEMSILKFQAKFGNKWAYIAAHLPGRTGNDVKNFWYSRNHKYRRVSLPHPPSNLCFQTLNESLQDAQHQGVQVNDFDTPDDVVFDHLQGNQGLLSCVPVLPDISAGHIMDLPPCTQQGPSASQNCDFMPQTMHHPKRLRASEAILPGFSYSGTNELPELEHYHKGTFESLNYPSALSLPYGPDPRGKNPTAFDMMPGSSALLNANCSTSESLTGPSMLELPSLQYPETDHGTWNMSSPQPPPFDSLDAFIRYPYPPQTTSMPVQSDAPTPRNSGLLDAVLYQAQTLSSKKNQPSEKRSTLNVGETSWEEFVGDISPFDLLATPGCSEPTLANGRVSSGEQTNPQAFSDRMKGISAQPKPSQIDPILDVGWHDIFEYVKDGSGVSDELPTVFQEDIFSHMGKATSTFGGCSDCKQTMDGISTFDQGWGGSSSSWKNMPKICEKSIFP